MTSAQSTEDPSGLSASPKGEKTAYGEQRSGAYWVCRITPHDPGLLEALNGLLSGLPFDAYQELEAGWIAYMPVESMPEAVLDEALDEILAVIPGQRERTLLPVQNWNAVWEAAFEPVIVSSRTVIRAPFHPAFGDRETELVIEPKMSFGTGHHATTRLMLRFLEQEKLAGKSVLDVGTGTGVLAIYTALHGAKTVLGIDHHPYARENARENCLRNGVNQVEIIEADAEFIAGKQADVVLANINRAVLLRIIPSLGAALAQGGSLLLSGLLASDEPLIQEAAAAAGLVIVDRLLDDAEGPVHGTTFAADADNQEHSLLATPSIESPENAPSPWIALRLLHV